MRPYCRAIRHFLDCHGNYKAIYVKGEVVSDINRALVQASPATPVLTSFTFSFSPPLPMDAYLIWWGSVWGGGGGLGQNRVRKE